MKKYYLASPFSMVNHGITNYVNSAEKVLLDAGVDVEVVGSDGPFHRNEFEKKLIAVASGGIVEIPDTHGMFSDGCDQFDLHVRLHAPISRLDSINQKKQNFDRIERELFLIEHAKFVSSPTIANADAYVNHGVSGFNDFLIFPNPLDFSGVPARRGRDIDVIFVGRHERLKGVDFFRQILMHYPAGVRVAIIGIKEQFKEYFSDDKFRCSIDFVGWSDNATKYDYLSRSKVCVMLSRFESYSMVVAEALACGCNVFAWNTGGAPEAFYGAPVRFIEKFDVRLMAAASLEAIVDKAPDEGVVSEFIAKNNNRFVDSVKLLIAGDSFQFKRSKMQIAQPESYFPSRDAIARVTREFVDSQSSREIKLAGVSMNCESSENMWGCLLGTVFSDYKLISRHPLGTYYKKGFDKKFEIDPEKYLVKDWFKQSADVAKDISEQGADVLFLFNGNTKQYRELVSRIYDLSHLVPVYSELGWLPQSNHVYFDVQGANAHSSIRWANLEALCGAVATEVYDSDFRYARALLTLQLPDDTTLQKDSFPRCMANQDLMAYVRAQVPQSIHLVVRQHPMDSEKYNLDGLENVSFDHSATFAESVVSVDSVIGVNSTILLEAMYYPVNIYSMGYGVFSDKGVTKDCSKKELGAIWIDRICFDAARRQAFLSYLAERQLNVVEFGQRPLVDVSEALYPIYLSMVIAESERDLGVRHGRPRTYLSKIQVKAASKKKLALHKPVDRVLRLEKKLTRLAARVEYLEAQRWIVFKLFYYLPYSVFQMISDVKSQKLTGRRLIARKLRKLIRDPKAFFVDLVLKNGGAR